MQTVTLQLFNQGQWWDAATLSFSGEQLSDSCSLCYEPEYILAKLNCPDEILNFPAIGFSNIKNKLVEMGVYDG